MVNSRHSRQTITDGGIHSAVAFEYPDSATRLAASGFTAEDQFKLAIQDSDNSVWILLDPTVPTWGPFGSGFNPSGVQGDILYNNGTGFVNLNASTDGYVLTTHSTGSNPTWSPGSTVSLSNTNPVNVANVSASPGVSALGARSDHQHAINAGTPINVGAVNNQGTATTLALSDHTHKIVDLGITSQVQGSTLYFNGTNWVQLSPAQDGYFLTTHNTGNNPTWTKQSTIATDFSISGQTIGDLIQFNGTNWVRIANGTTGQFLKANTGTLSNWALQSTIATDLNIIGETQGDVLYFNGVNWVRLAAGTIGQALITQGVGANPKWDSNFVAQNLTTTGTLNVGAPITINAVAANPNILQAAANVISGTGQTLSLLSQSNSAINSRGGNLSLGSGQGTSAQGAPDGYVIINRGVQTVASWLTGISPNTGVASDDFIAFGKTPGATGNIRFSSESFIYGNNVSQTTDFKLIGWTNNQLVMGGTAYTTGLAGSQLNLQAATGTINFNVGSIINSFSNTGILSFDQAASNAGITVITSATISTVGKAINVSSQTSAGFNSRGGILNLSSGTGTTIAPVAGDLVNGGAPDGYIQIFRGTQQIAGWNTGMRQIGTLQHDDFISFGKFGPNQGSIRLAPNSNIIGRNFANTTNQTLLSWSQTGSDLLQISNNAVNTFLTGSAVNINTSSSLNLVINNASHLITTTSFIFDATNNLGSTRSVGINGGQIPVGGVGQTLSILGQSGAGNFNSRGGNLQLSSGVGSSAQGASDGYLTINRGNQLVAQWQTGNVLTGQTLTDDFITLGRIAANTGNIRLANNSNIAWRNVANNADLTGIRIDTSNNLNIGDGASDIIYNANGASEIHRFQLGGTDQFTIALGGLTTARTVFNFSGGNSTIGMPVSSATSGPLSSLTVQAQNGSGNGTITNGTLFLSGGSFSGGTGTHTGGDAVITGGTGSTSATNGNISLGGPATNWQGMANGIQIVSCTAVPTGNPPLNTYFVYVDPSDNKLKGRASTGTITAFCIP